MAAVIDHPVPDPPVRHGGGQLQRILVPVDAAGRADDALALAAQLGSSVSGVVRVVHVRIFDPPVRGSGRFYPETPAAAAAVVDRALLAAWACGSNASGEIVVAQRSAVASAIVTCARSWQAGVIVLARRPRRALPRLLTHNVTDEVMRYASCPVLVVRPRER